MEEVGDDSSDGFLIIDKSLKDFCGTNDCLRRGDGDNIVIGNSCWYKTRGSFLDYDFIACGADTDFAITLKTHADDEGVVLDHIAMERTRRLNHLDTEVRGVEEFVGTLVILAMIGLVLGIDMKVDGLGCQFGMEFTRLPIKSKTIVIVDAIGDIAGLLYLGQTNATTDGMNTTGRKIEDITLLYFMLGKDRRNGR